MRSIPLIGALAIIALNAAPAGGEKPVNEIIVTLNGLEIAIDQPTGTILRLSYPGVGAMLQSSPERASAIDLAYPIAGFEPLRAASRYSRDARVTVTDDAVVIYWEKLGLSRDFRVDGSVSATVRLKAAPDGRSIIMTGEVANDSQNPVRQVVFPDLAGLLPFAGMDKTYFRTGGFAGLPFLELAPNESKASTQYMIDFAAYSVEHKAGGIFNDMFVRWMDIGGLTGGLSLFPKRWGWDPQVTVRLHLSEIEDKIRLLCVHDVTIKPGEKWRSGEFWLTPHECGWAKGIEPYREWVKRNYKREYPVPRHVREGLGYRTTWMCQTQPHDPLDAIFTFRDLPKLAKEGRDHGLDEMVLWAWNKGFVLPLPGPYAHLGTERDMVNAVKECKKLGVNVAPFISVLQANPETAPRYGLKVTDNNGWTYHTELIPRWNPPYATAFSCVPVGPLNPKWQEDVLAGCKHLVDIGIDSLSWDQYWTTNDPPPNMNSLSSQIRAYAKQRDPESTFSGEELWNLEIDSAYLDYTWNWGGYRDCRAFTSVFPSPRVNCCITSSAAAVKKAFADNLYLNVFPRKKESVNGSDYITNYPDLSRALKQCAKLRKQFLAYFVGGTLIGECLLTEPSPGTHTCAYVLPDRVMMVVINEGDRREVEVRCDFAPWLASASGNYQVESYDADGKPLGTVETGSRWQGKLGPIERSDLVVVEISRHL